MKFVFMYIAVEKMFRENSLFNEVCLSKKKLSQEENKDEFIQNSTQTLS